MITPQNLHDAIAIVLSVERGEADAIEAVISKYSSEELGQLFGGMAWVTHKLVEMLAREIRMDAGEFLEGVLEDAFGEGML